MVLEGDDGLVGHFNELDCELVRGHSGPFVIWGEFDIVDWKCGGPEELLEGIFRYRVFRNGAMLVASEEEVVLYMESAT